jgi:hypothetical protein
VASCAFRPLLVKVAASCRSRRERRRDGGELPQLYDGKPMRTAPRTSVGVAELSSVGGCR